MAILLLMVSRLESNSRLALINEAMVRTSLTALEAWRSTIIEVSCSSLIARIIECKYSRVIAMMEPGSCPSSASKARDQASS